MPANLRPFPRPETGLYKMISDPEFKKAFRPRIRLGNRFMAPLYKVGLLPLLGMGRQIMLLTTRGRKSNKLRDTPIGYYRIDGAVHVFTGWGKTNWYQNLLAYPDDVTLQIGFRRFRARPEVVEDAQELQRTLEGLVIQDPKGAHLLMGWDPAQDRVETADFSRMIENVLVVRFHPR